MGDSLWNHQQIWREIDAVMDKHLRGVGKQPTADEKTALFQNAVFPEIEELHLEEFEYAVHEEEFEDMDEEVDIFDLLEERFEARCRAQYG